MCGIAGWYLPRPYPGPVLRRMADRIRHRGPDEEGYHVEGPVALAIRRLSVIDLCTGRQPYRSEDGSVTAVFNGEIYNFQELRRDLEARGHRFATRTDGEVLVHLYEELGQDFVEPLNGMFAVALWDAPRGSLVLARDRLGIKPLYVAPRPGGLAFASELKALLELPDLARRLNPEALDRYLSFEYVPAPDCILEGVFKLPPAHVLTVDSDGIRQRPYWSL
ncbi:MAG: asparagine synthetase B, partial [Candidatus Eremiobacterota bacterium]